MKAFPNSPYVNRHEFTYLTTMSGRDLYIITISDNERQGTIFAVRGPNAGDWDDALSESADIPDDIRTFALAHHNLLS